MPAFPSVEWLEAVAKVAMNDDQYKKYGRIDALVGVKVEDEIFAMTFDVFDIRDIRKITMDEARDLDFYMDMPAELWQKMIESAKKEGHVGLEYTLNTLDLKRPGGVAINALDDGYRADKFFRFNESLQRFFDVSGAVETTFPVAV